jgi:3-oxoacyl-[acyl-carrier-protein] synthase-3
MTAYAKVIGTGGYLPAEIKTNEDISRTVDTSDSWILDKQSKRLF